MHTPHHDFWHTTWTVWRSGALNSLSSAYAKEAERTFDDWLSVNATAKSKCLRSFLDTNMPVPDEFLLGFKENRRQVALLVTNQRIWMRESANGALLHFSVAEIDLLESKAHWSSRVVTIRRRNGQTTIYENVPFAPTDELARLVVSRLGSIEKWLAPSMEAEEGVDEASPSSSTVKTDEKRSITGLVGFLAGAVFMFFNWGKIHDFGSFVIYFVGALFLGIASEESYKAIYGRKK